jgi:hypothetical protein
MTIFSLLVYSCVTITNGLGGGGDALTMTCRWDQRGLYVDEGRCNEGGRAAAGELVHEFSVVVGATPRKVEKHSCNPISVIK